MANKAIFFLKRFIQVTVTENIHEGMDMRLLSSKKNKCKLWISHPRIVIGNRTLHKNRKTLKPTNKYVKGKNLEEKYLRKCIKLKVCHCNPNTWKFHVRIDNWEGLIPKMHSQVLEEFFFFFFFFLFLYFLFFVRKESPIPS
jgi:hypothetical protein